MGKPEEVLTLSMDVASLCSCSSWHLHSQNALAFAAIVERWLQGFTRDPRAQGPYGPLRSTP